MLCAIANALQVPQENIFKVAGFFPFEDTPMVERAFPGLKLPKQHIIIRRIADRLSMCPNLSDEDLDNLFDRFENLCDDQSLTPLIIAAPFPENFPISKITAEQILITILNNDDNRLNRVETVWLMSTEHQTPKLLRRGILFSQLASLYILLESVS